jgi:hypothetical protein
MDCEQADVSDPQANIKRLTARVVPQIVILFTFYSVILDEVQEGSLYRRKTVNFLNLVC